MVIVIPKPLYYKGWVIQPKFDGFYVSDRKDHDRDTSMRLDSLDKAYGYIDRKVREKQ